MADFKKFSKLAYVLIAHYNENGLELENLFQAVHSQYLIFCDLVDVWKYNRIADTPKNRNRFKINLKRKPVSTLSEELKNFDDYCTLRNTETHRKAVREILASITNVKEEIQPASQSEVQPYLEIVESVSTLSEEPQNVDDVKAIRSSHILPSMINIKDENYYDEDTSYIENPAFDEPDAKKAKRIADCLHTKDVYNRYLTELVSSKEDEFTEKGNEIANALRRIAKRNIHMADKVYFNIRRMILDVEENVHRSTTRSTLSQVIIPLDCT